MALLVAAEVRGVFIPDQVARLARVKVLAEHASGQWSGDRNPSTHSKSPFHVLGGEILQQTEREAIVGGVRAGLSEYFLATGGFSGEVFEDSAADRGREHDAQLQRLDGRA